VLLQLLVQQQQQQQLHHMLLLQHKMCLSLQQHVHSWLPQHLTSLLCLGSWERCLSATAAAAAACAEHHEMSCQRLADCWHQLQQGPGQGG
jgi:hypothetical protein